jgi:hypothetical protein
MFHRNLLIATAVIASVITTACSDTTAPQQLVPEAVAAAVLDPSLSATFPQSGALHVTKECSQYNRLAGGFCTITSSNIREIEVGARVIYASDAVPPVLDTDVLLDPPGRGNNAAFGHVVLDFVTLRGHVTISGGTGKFTWFEADAVVTHLTGPNWAWDGTYSFSPRD